MGEVAKGILKVDAATDEAIMPSETVDIDAIFRAALAPDSSTRQRVPIVRTAKDGAPSRPWFLCGCGRRCLVLYRPNSADHYACPKCGGISYKPPSSGELAHKLYVRELIAQHGLEAVSTMARAGLRKRLDAALKNHGAING